ncbi:1,4-alpha-glucan branching protein GlgB [Sinomonas sp. ASV486]|uniref:1,4-alpha-glucan branching protein GlgB n=1 Tax=Sinomonas sp. ASV486 TaxID=3051170 RepID=UPI0027DC28D4|nr:1,4-alpha-glucan branching protein GlgB [Sinomonas sp. ASV486]MDQ4492329.1 1,4-alpha-glucan branching protein GlgB [Sinomonas sp. ASV486]
MTDHAALHPTLHALLEEWLPAQRWFPAKGREVEFAPAGRLVLPTPQGAPRLELLFVRVRAGRLGAVLNVPLALRRDPVAGGDAALVGRARDLDGVPVWAYDAVHEPAFAAALVGLMASGTRIGGDGTAAIGTASGEGSLPSGDLTAALLRGEQSNSSIIVRSASGNAMVKVFRQLAEGLNPEVELGAALAHAHAADAATALGWIDVEWRATSGESVRGQLAVAHEFLEGGTDMWRVALDAAAQGRDLSEEARGLGAATARIHAALAATLGTQTLDGDAVDAFVGRLSDRLRAAWEEVRTSVGVPDAALESLLTTLAEHRAGLVVQRIHGDFHLGQVLHFPDSERQFAILDFEGEPLRPVAERSQPDVVLRDVIGMLRSFDYAAGAALRTDPAARVPEGWAEAVGEAYWDGYESVAGGENPFGTALFAALWLDKALYEVSYEERNRPAWAEIPLRAARTALEAWLPGRGQIPARKSFDGVLRAPEGLAIGSAETPSGEETDVADGEYAASAEQRGAGQGAAEHDGAVRPGMPSTAAEQAAGVMQAPSHTVAGAGEHAPIAVDPDVLARVGAGASHAPHAVLGAHLDGEGTVTIRALKHLATSVTAVTPAGRVPLTHEAHGVWVGTAPEAGPGHVPDYRLEVEYGEGHVVTVDDPYRYMPSIGELDLHLIGEGRHEELWRALGAHVERHHSVLGAVEGTSFKVWAPNAQAVQVKGDFNGWDGREHAMRSLGSSGVWEVFIPGVVAGMSYKFGILTRYGHWVERADPMAFGTEVPPHTASRVVESRYAFKDEEWMTARAAGDPHNSPMSVYEVHVGSWRLGLGYRELADQLVEYVTEMGFTHVEFMPVAEHPFGGSWGYQVTSYYAPSSRFGHPDDFRYLVDRLHQAGIGVIVDWVPAHFPKDEWALARFDGEPLYEHADPQQGEHPDWGTLIFNFGRTEVRNFLVANAQYWLEEFHIDGLRVDAVASMLYLDYSREEGQWRPNQYGGRENLEAISFLQETNATAYKRNPGIVMIAEESTAFPGVTKPTSLNGLGFGLKWNMGWMNDSLQYMEENPVNRKWHHNKMTFSIVYAFSENFLLPISHDEVVHGKGSMLRKMPGDRWQQLANLRAFYAFQWAHPGKQLMFMGCEFGQEGEWNQEHGLEWWMADLAPHKGLQKLIAQLNAVYRATPALYEKDNDPSGYEWIRGDDADHNVLSFIRWSDDGTPLVCIANFAGNPQIDYTIGLPQAGRWREVVNTDDAEYGGSGVTNGGLVAAEAREWDGKPATAVLTLPPLGVVYLVPEAPQTP